MTEPRSRMAERAVALQRDFDESFALPARGLAADRIELLAIQLGGDPHAIRLAEIDGLFADRRITPVPGPVPELCGLASLRGALVPVYDLRLLLGYTPGGPPPRWLVLAAAAPVGLAFDQLDRHAMAAPEDIVAEPAGAGGAARQVVRVQGGTGATLLHLPSLLKEIRTRALRGHPRQER